MSGSALEALIEIRLPEKPASKFHREKRAFFRLLPGLLATHSGQYVAIHDEQVVDSGPDQLEVALRVQRRFGAAAIYVHLVGDGLRPTCRSGMIRDLSQPEARS